METQLFLWKSPSTTSLKAWKGKKENVSLAQEALSHRALMNKLAANGAWNKGLEQ